ncbi:MAG: ABC transporter permease subunit [Eubacteriales bacterium]|jgi:ABC-2 type transport system permease protein|nr:ABC transporter permease subunit [Clostridiales bacterium]
MINWTLYKRGIQGSVKTLLIFAAVITMYFSIIVSMFDPNLENVLDEFAKAMPELFSMVGMNPVSTELVGFMEAYLYGFIMLIFPMLFSIISAYRLVARHVDRGSMTYLLAAPVNRATVAFTQMKVMGTGIFLLVLYATLLGIVNCELAFPGELDIGRFIMLNVGALCLHLFIGGICFLCSCIFSESKYAVGLGAGIPTLQFIIQMIANTGEKLEGARYATFFTLYNSGGIIAGEQGAMWGLVALFAGAVALYALAIAIFTKRDLHI